LLPLFFCLQITDRIRTDPVSERISAPVDFHSLQMNKNGVRGRGAGRKKKATERELTLNK